MRTYDIGCTIQEVMESYEVEVDGKVFPGTLACEAPSLARAHLGSQSKRSGT